MTFSAAELEEAHAHVFENVREVRASGLCACYFCKKYFPPSAIREWLNPIGEAAFETGPVPGERATAFCPTCQFDMVIGDASGLPIQNIAFLQALDERFSHASN
jgi:hypothetical protein